MKRLGWRALAAVSGLLMTGCTSAPAGHYRVVLCPVTVGISVLDQRPAADRWPPELVHRSVQDLGPGCRPGTGVYPSIPARPPQISTSTPPPWTGTAAEGRFAWAEDGYLADGATVTIARGISPRAALSILVQGARHGRIGSPADARAWAERSPAGTVVRAGRLSGGWTIVVEDNNFLATDEAKLRRLSAKGAAVVIFTNVEADSSFQYAIGGRIRRAFDPLGFGSPWTGSPLPQERGIRFGDEADRHPMAQSFLLAYRLTGRALTESDLTTDAGRIAVGVDF